MPEFCNIKKVIEQSQKLTYFTSTNFVLQMNNDRSVVHTEVAARVDYDAKSAKIVTVTSQDNNRIGVACYYEDKKLTVKPIDLSDNSEDNNSDVKTFEDAEWDHLFAANGQLRPLVFDNLKPLSNMTGIANVLGLDLTSPEVPKNDNMATNIIARVISEDSLVLNNLVSYSSPENNLLTTIDSQITVNLLD